MLNIQQSSTPANNKKPLSPGQLLIIINGTLPDIETLGNEEKSERAVEKKRYGINKHNQHPKE
jgi:hypothetical protein